jgi:nucleotide-binding universal stress UspA family protein
MTWIVGLGLRSPGDGALRLAGWLAAGGGEPFTAVHVLEHEHLRAVLRHHPREEVRDGARREAERAVAADGAPRGMGPPEIVEAITAVEGIEEAARRLGAGAIVVGRRAGQGSRAPVRLGRTARALLRRLPAPVLVVPPDLDPGALGPGPVVALTSLDDDAIDAARFARGLAARAGRPLVLVHVVPGVEGAGTYLPARALESAARDRQVEAEMALDAWVDAHGIEADGVVVLQGSVVDAALEFAAGRGAPLLVTGSRRLSLAERALFNSVGSELAAAAPVPVAVVPPGERAAAR